MEVRVREKCAKCNGEGFIDHPQMIAFRKAWDNFKEEINRELTPQDVDKVLGTLGLDKLIMAERCDQCNMYGYVESWMPFDKLKELKNLEN